MSKQEKTSPKIASQASRILQNKSASNTTKSLAGSALAQSNTNKSTSNNISSLAAKALDNSRSSKTTKSLAGSVLTQKKK